MERPAVGRCDERPAGEAHRTTLRRALALLLFVGCYTPSTASRDARVAGFLARSGEAPAGEPLGGPLTLDEAMRRALARSPSVAAARANRDALRAAVDAAPSIENPELRVGGLVLDELLDDRPEVDVRVRVRPPRPVENEARKAEATALAREADAALLEEEAALRALVRTRYLEVHLTRAELAAQTALAAATSELHAALERQLDDGRTTKLDLAVAAFERERAAQGAAEAEGARDRAEAELADSLGVSGTLQLADPVIVPLPDVKQCVATALQRQPGVEEKLARLDAANAILDREEAQQVPWFSFLELGYAFGPNTEDPLGFFVGAGLTLPIFDTNASSVEAAEAAVKAREAEVEGELARTAADVRALHRRAELARRLYERFESETKPAADRVLAEAASALAASTIPEVDFLEAKVQAAEAAVRAADLQRAAAEQALALDEVGECLRPGPAAE